MSLTNRAGRPPKHWAERARVWAWYYEVTRRCKWNDYKLDHEFAWVSDNPEDRPLGNRPRTFEWIRKVARKQRGTGGGRWRNMEQLVDEVDRHVRFHGTAAMYRSPIWTLFQTAHPKVSYLDAALQSILDKYGLVRINPAEFPEFSRVDIDGVPAVFDDCISSLLNRIDRFSGLTLLWILYLANNRTENASIRGRLEERLDQRLDSTFGIYLQKIPDLPWLCYGNALEVLKQAQAQQDVSDKSFFIRSMFPIVQKSHEEQLRRSRYE